MISVRRCCLWALFLPATLVFLPQHEANGQAPGAPRRGYYRDVAVSSDTVVFSAEGDLWTVGLAGGAARRLTSAPGMENRPFLSPDGQTIAFRADYEGPAEVYTMPVGGGLPQRRTWDGNADPEGWTPDGRILYRTSRFSTLPVPQLAVLDGKNGREILPLASASEATYTGDGHTLIFTRWEKQPSFTKRYKGGYAENLWRFDGKSEAVPLTADWTGTSHAPLFANGRVYFLSDRDGIMNVWSMDTDGHGLKQETHQRVFDVQSAAIAHGHLVYTCAGDVWSLDPKSGAEAVLPVTLSSDFDQLRDHWVKKPAEYLTSAHLAPDGSHVVFTARGEVFTLPAKPGRVVRVAGESDVRYREARYLPDGKSIVALSTASGETEFWKYPANGVGKPEQWTNDARVLRWEGVPSPDGHWLAHRDKDQQLWLYDVRTRKDKRVAQSTMGDFNGLSWSPDSRWLAFVETASNSFDQVKVLAVETSVITPVTSDRYNSEDPAWSADGKWLYLLSDRNLTTTVNSPWGTREPEPHFDRPAKLYELALTAGLRSPFAPPDELHPDTPGKDGKPAEEKKSDEKKDGDKAADEKKDGKDKVADDKDKADKNKADKDKEGKPPEVKIDLNGITLRLNEVPVAAGNYGNLTALEKRLCWLDASTETPRKQTLKCVDIANKGDEPDTLMSDVRAFEVSADRKKMLLAKNDDFFLFDADAKSLNDPKMVSKAKIDLSHWQIETDPQTEFRGLFLDAWRLERDYFYDRGMQGVNWVAMRERYLPLVARAATRDELNDVISQMVGELSALHTFVGGGDGRESADKVDLGSLGARLRRDEAAGGFVVEHVYANDPDQPAGRSPLARPDSVVQEGEVIVSIDGQSLLGVPDERALLRGKAGTEVLLHVKAAAGAPGAPGASRDVLVKPIKSEDERNLRYAEWEYTRRLKVEADSGNTVGYVHLRAMGSDDINQWAREFYPVFDRQGLIIDVRHNNGGNIDSWLLSKLLRQAWFYFQPRVGDPSWNMQYAFRGHIVVLCDEGTASDGEAFAEGFRRLHLGTVIGTRTWGGEIWLSGSNVQADNGVATAAEIGVYGPDGKWLIEGHGVDPDTTVDNLPHATYAGSDAQLQAAVALLKQQIQADPRPVPHAPPYPNKSFTYGAAPAVSSGTAVSGTH